MKKSDLKKVPGLQKLVSLLRGNQQKKQPVVGEGNVITNNGRFTNVRFDIKGNNNEIIIGRNARLVDVLIYIRGDHHKLIIGENCVYGGGELWMEDHHCSIIVHSNTTVESAHLAVTEPNSKIEIMHDCMLSRYIEIRTGDSHSIVDLQSGERINYAANVTLGEHVWVGAHAKILKGVSIGSHSVIGTASLVTADIPANVVAAGIPAKVIKSGIDWKRERIYQRK